MNSKANNKLMMAKTEQEAKDVLSAGADLHNRDSVGRTPIMIMLENRAPYEVIKFVVDIDPSIVNESDNDDVLVVMYALQYGATRHITKLLIDKTNDINQKDRYGATSLIYAFRHGAKRHIKKLLIDKTKDIDAKYRPGGYGWGNRYKSYITSGNDRTALMEACRAGAGLETIDLLIKKGAAVNAEDMRGWTPLWYAVYHGNLATVKYLLKNGAIIDLNKKDCYDHNILFYTQYSEYHTIYNERFAPIKQILLEHVHKQIPNLAAKQARKKMVRSK